MSGGGGGGTSHGRAITQAEVAQILSQARLEVYMALALKEQTVENFPWPELFSGDDNIYQLIYQTQIYGNKSDCHDSFGNSRDGSIHSPVPNTICISLKNLSEKLTVDNARAQILALVAHEYSHLKGFDEEKATALQNMLTPLFANSSSEQAWNVLDYMTRQSMNLGDGVADYNNRPKYDLGWDFLCFNSEKIENALVIIEQRFTDRPFSISTKALYKKQNSYLIKQRAITTQVCAKSKFHPQKLYFENWVQKWFGNTDVLSDRDLAQEVLASSDFDVSRNILIEGNVKIGKINTFVDFDREFKDMQKYIYDDLRFHLNRLWDLTIPIVQQ